MGEHSSVAANMATLERLGKKTADIPIDPLGRVSPELLSQTLERHRDIRFAAIMAASNETGTLNDMTAIRDVLRAADGPRIHLHCDAVQAVGKVPVDLAGWDVDSAAFSAHKIGGPRGIGLLYLRRPLDALCRGGGQESNVRAGTENVAGALALASLMEERAAGGRLPREYEKAKARWESFLSALAAMPRCRLIPEGRGTDDERFSPYIVQAAFRDIPGEVMTRALDDMGFAVSTGAACSSASAERRVLAAMGVGEGLSLEGIRVSQGWTTTDADIDALLAGIAEVLKFL